MTRADEPPAARVPSQNAAQMSTGSRQGDQLVAGGANNPERLPFVSDEFRAPNLNLVQRTDPFDLFLAGSQLARRLDVGDDDSDEGRRPQAQHSFEEPVEERSSLGLLGLLGAAAGCWLF